MKKLLPIQYAKVLYRLTEGLAKSDLEKVVVGFITFLKQRQVLSKSELIIKAFERYSKEQAGIKFLKISSAKKLTEKQLNEIIKNFGKEVEVETNVDPNLIGGVVLQDGNTILDGSIKTQLKKLENKLM